MQDDIVAKAGKGNCPLLLVVLSLLLFSSNNGREVMSVDKCSDRLVPISSDVLTNTTTLPVIPTLLTLY